MKTYFGKILQDKREASTVLFWYRENIRTFEDTLINDNVRFEIIYRENYERVYLINDEAFVYLGILTKKYNKREYNNSNEIGYGGAYVFQESFNRITTSEVVICELNYNSYKGIHKSVFAKVSRKSSDAGVKWIGFPTIIVNYPYYSKHRRFIYTKCLKHAIRIIKNYDIRKSLNEFKGKPMCVAIYRIEGGDGLVGYATYCFDKLNKAHEFARNCLKDSLIYCLEFADARYRYEYPKLKYQPGNLIIQDKFKTILKDRLTINGEQSKDAKDAIKYIKYCLINVNDTPHPYKDRNYGEMFIANKILRQCVKGEFDQYHFYSCSDEKIKYKNEFLVYQIIKKLYPTDTIYQYRPMFLKSDKGGQMSYDVYISGLRVAIEFQGEQHFKPVDFFGGNEAFKNYLKRDEIKKKISEENGIKLIYVRYDEIINEDTIKEKINKVIQ